MDWRLPLLIAVTAILLAGVLLAMAVLTIREGDRQAVQAEASRIAHAVEQRIGSAVTLVQGARGLFAAVGRPSQPQFAAYVSELGLRERYPGVQGLGLSEFVPPERLAGFEAEQRERTGTEFRVWPAGPRDAYSSVVLLEPRDARNAAALGYDMFADPTRRSAMQAARQTGHLAASGKVVLVQEIDPDKQNGFLLYAPVSGGTAGTAPLTGWVYAPLRVGDLLTGVRAGAALVAYEAYAGPHESPSDLLHRTADWPSTAAVSTTRTIKVADRTWLLVFRSLPALEARSQMRLVPWLAVLCVVAAGLLGWVAWLQARAAATAREADQRKTEFLATLAHELRNPLAPVRNAVEILNRSPSPLLAARMREVLDRQVRHMTRLIDDLLDVSRVSRGKLELQLAEGDLREAVDDAVEACTPGLQAKAQVFCYERPSGPVTVRMDPTRVAQIVTNLLRNASSYTPPGGRIELSLALASGEARAEVRDEGMGIEPAHLQAIFGMFVQLPGRSSHGGLGIGLGLSSRLAQMHGGRIEAHSEGPGRGALFRLVLPCGAPAA